MLNIAFWMIGTLIAVLSPIILIHEFGHFLLAKLAGVRVEEFGFGFPPRMLGLWYGKGYLDIENTRVTIPAGFRLPNNLATGMYVEAVVEERRGTLRLRRIALTGPEMTVAMPCNPGERAMRGLVTTLERGTLYSLNWLPMGAFVRMTGEESPDDPRGLAAQPKRWRTAILSAGAIINIIAAVVLMSGAYLSGIPDGWLVEITDVEANGAAAVAGLEPGDVVVALDGHRITDGVGELQEFVHARPNQEITLTILRDGERLQLSAVPRLQSGGYGMLGIVIADWPDRSALIHYSLPEAFQAGMTDIRTIIAAMAQLPFRIAQGSVAPQDVRPTGMVGISQVLTFSLQQAIEWKMLFPILQTAGLISLALGLTNLLPLPGLDGGRIVFVLIETIRGRRVSPELEATAHAVGMILMIGLALLMLVQDFANPIIPWSLLQ